jgi:hypothetical protein
MKPRWGMSMCRDHIDMRRTGNLRAVQRLCGQEEAGQTLLQSPLAYEVSRSQEIGREMSPA